jgi:hypothetical protein
MNLTAMTSRFVSVATLGVLCAFTAVAGPIAVANSSFESPGTFLGIGCPGTGCSFSIAPISGWTTGLGAASGQFRPGNPSNTDYFNTLTDGSTIAYSDGATLSQTAVFTPVLEGFVYTLMVDLGNRINVPFDASADLLINGHHIAASGLTPASGNWSTFTATYIGLQADAGALISIELLSSGSQAEFDNVRLSVSDVAVPEPADVTLLGLGLAGLLAFARRLRAR